MGHANLTNLSQAFSRQLYAKGQVSIKEVAAFCIQHHIYCQASECAYGEDGDDTMVCFGLMEIVNFWLGHDEGPIVEPVEVTPEQQLHYNQWIAEQTEYWDCREWEIFDSIQWKHAAGWRKKYPNIPLLGNITN